MRSLASTSFPLFLADAIFLNFCNLSLIEFLSVAPGLFCFNFRVGLFVFLPNSITGCEISSEVSFLAMERWYWFSRCSKASLFRFESLTGVISTHSFLVAVLFAPGRALRFPRIFSTSLGLSDDGRRILDFGADVLDTGEAVTPERKRLLAGNHLSTNFY